MSRHSFLEEFFFKEDKLISLAKTLSPTSIITKSSIFDKLNETIIYAGRPIGMTLDVFIGLSVLGGLTGMALGCLLMLFKTSPLIILVLILLGSFLPYIYIDHLREVREKDIRKTVPQMVDLLRTSVKVGVELSIAINTISSYIPGYLGKELRMANNEIKTGVPRRQAFLGIIKRTGVDILESFVITINLAEERGGMNLSTVLDSFNKTVKERRLLDLKKKANQMPMKCMVPIFVCIIPAMLAMILVPIIIKFKNTQF
ncbi:MAG: type II secretion system F family protein [Clostridia bacterium]|nr:type II secretion system F family protein [Clostridia bacterium]